MLTAGSQRTVAVVWRLSGLARGLITLALGGLLLAVITRRPEFAGVAAPAVLLLVPRASGRTAAVGLTFSVAAEQITETELTTVLARITGHGDATVRLRLYPAA